MKNNLIKSIMITASMLSINSFASQTVRIATFNVSMDATNYTPKGQMVKADALVTALESNHQQIKNIAEIIQRVRPNVLLLNEFDYVDKQAGIDVFVNNYLKVSQKQQQPIDYPYIYLAPVNTGVPSGFDLDNNGKVTDNMGDAYGFGFFPGHYAMVLLSQYPIDFDKARTFQKFKTKDMPNAQIPVNPSTNENWYSAQELDAIRLSSKSFWDVPIIIDDKPLHILASHPTPPVFDGPEDRNGMRNHNEVRLVADYVLNKNYIYDDKGIKGGLDTQSRFVILGDLNAAPIGDKARVDTTDQLLKNKMINASYVPQSEGAKQEYIKPYAKNYTANWQARVDYVLPSNYGLQIQQGGVFWPMKSSPLYRLIKDRNASSDHRMVWLDITVK
ncbi:endonuclease/exonuclease/phosphatase family protein [Pseudoalteromonas sp. MMG010]|uniref:endonuclease/exonuclease/phosphatase family protein n=1 Tax=Pseudoalteromonas sp. MMG010 TaxID=2822685 RepID=UPI001B3A0AE4|nr:endonuclease/exonuclease/phosphatase family protein [Pseudoalteromonas sp. MMG010]MBQ4832437.1 endonuclease/exonuclease/phosphatase family protein [Pseudoalteromonas sp. MMG010]